MRKLALFALPFLIAAAVYVYFLSALIGLIAGGLCMLAFIALFIFARKRQRALIVCFGLAAGLLWSCVYEQLILQPVWDYSEQTLPLTVEVSGYPEATAFGCRIEARAKLTGRPARMMLYINEPDIDLAPGDSLQANIKLRRSTKGTDGEDFLYFQSNGIQLLGYVRGKAEITPCQSTPVRHWPAVSAHAVQQMIAKIMPEDCVGYLQALLTGDKSGLSFEERNAMSVSGVSHTVAISGMHVSILLAMLYLLLGKRSRLSALIGIPLVLFFVFFTGCSPSVVRAAVMQIIFLMAPILHRENDPFTSLSAALLFILLQNPWAVSNVSFQLSFAAMAGIFLFTQRLYNYFQRPARIQKLLKNRFGHFPTSFIITCISTTLSALIFTIPIAAAVFGSFAIYSLLTNLLVLWAVSLIFTVGLLACLLGFLWLPAAKLAGLLPTALIRYVLHVTQRIAGFPGAQLYTSSFYVVLFLFFCYAVIGITLLVKGKKRLWLPAASILLGLGIVFLMNTLNAAQREFSVTAVDVGQGACAFIRQEHYAVMVDCGGEENAGQAAAQALYGSGADGLTCLIITHYDTDHISGIPHLLEMVSVQTLYLPEHTDDSGGRQYLEQLAAEQHIAVEYVLQDIQLTLGKATLQIFAPVSDADDNAASLSVLYSVGEYDTLITGDMDTDAEGRLLGSHTLPDIELFIAGHHGSKYSTGFSLLKRLQPETVLISVGTNSYGHPAQEVLERLAAIGARVYRTDHCGNITVGR